MKRFGILSVALCATLIISCVSIPDSPEVWQCQFNGTPRKFFCVNSRTNEEMTLESTDPLMKASQCLSADDYLATQKWVGELIRQLEDCRSAR